MTEGTPVLVIAVACIWIAVWLVCLALALRFVMILVTAAVLQTWESLRGWRSRG